MIRKNCKECGKFFWVYPYREGSAKYCSKSCMENRLTKTCPVCDEEFETPKSVDSKWCSKECRYKNSGKNVECGYQECGNTVYRRNCEIKKGGDNYCSRECMYKQISLDKRDGEVIECDNVECNEKFYKSYYLINKSENNYCSNKCKRKGRKTGKYINCINCGERFYAKKCEVEAGKKYCSQKCHYNNSRTGAHKGCLNCGDEFYTLPSQDSDYCSFECWKNDHSQTIECDNCGKHFKAAKSEIEAYDRHYCSVRCVYDDRRLYPNTRKLRAKVMAKKKRDNLHETYVKAKIQQSSGISFKDIPQELIELKRLNIKRKRIIRNHNQKS